MLITDNNAIDTPYELILAIAIVLFIMILLAKLGTLLEGLPTITKKKKEVVKEVKKEVKKEVESSKEESKTKSEQSSNVNQTCNDSFTCPYAKMNLPSVTGNETYGQSNYLYDRFVVTPTSIDVVENRKISNSFLTSDELAEIKNQNIKIELSNEEDRHNKDKSKDNLHGRIKQMTTSNHETKERLLKEFEGLSKEMKLFIIENIIQKM